jgi:hypothetical protein
LLQGLDTIRKKKLNVIQKQYANLEQHYETMNTVISIDPYAGNLLYNHTHFESCFYLCHTIFLVTICFGKKHHSFESLSHSLVAQNIFKDFFVNVIIIGKIQGKY